jgi:DNA polymerase III subunit alpha
MNLEDYRNSWELDPVRSGLHKFKNYYVKDCPLLIKGKIQPKYYNEEELELKVKSMSLLANAREDLIKSISLDVPLSFINQDTINSLVELTEKNKGDVLLKFRIIEKKTIYRSICFPAQKRYPCQKKCCGLLKKPLK